MFPPSMLSSLYVKGSLRNTANGFELRLRNNIDSGTVTGLGPLGVDDAAISPDKVVMKVGQKEMRGDQLSYRTPLPVGVMSEIYIAVEGEPLAPGQHKLSFQIMTAEAGKLTFSITETV